MRLKDPLILTVNGAVIFMKQLARNIHTVYTDCYCDALNILNASNKATSLTLILNA